MELKQVYQIYELLENYDNMKYRKIICHNMKKYRKELYDKYKEEYKRRGTENPYSISNISAYLNVSDIYFRRLESENDKHKKINIDNLIKLSIILNKSLDDFLIEEKL